MRILVIGSGGREHVLCWKLKQSPLVRELYCSPGNGGTALTAENVDMSLSEHQAVIEFCGKKEIDLVVVGPEAPLAIGITDDLTRAGMKVFGPDYAAARMESSKIFAKEIMGRYNIPTASFRIFDNFEKAKEHIMFKGAPLVVKAFGLAAGKGVVVAETVEAAVIAAETMLVEKRFGAAGHKIIVEEFLTGEEVSILVVTDGKNILPLVSSQDHKRVFDGDTGPNTGGMGAYSPAPIIDDETFSDVMETIIRPTVEGLRNEGISYRGVLYAGLMMTDDGPKVLEYNVRFGDPETQVILPRMKTDLAELLMAVAEGDISGKKIEWDERSCVCVVAASKGYPGPYEKGLEITGLENVRREDELVFHAGTKQEDGKFYTTGGRVLNIVGFGRDIAEAVENTYKTMDNVGFEGMHYRKDIGFRAVSRMSG